MLFSRLAMPHRPSFAIYAFLEDKMGDRTKNATKIIIERQFCSVLKGSTSFVSRPKHEDQKCN